MLCPKKKLLCVKGASCCFHEKTLLRLISIRPYGTKGVLFNANPGLRCACPGLFSSGPSGTVALRLQPILLFHPTVGRRGRCMTDTSCRSRLVFPQPVKPRSLRALTYADSLSWHRLARRLSRGRRGWWRRGTRAGFWDCRGLRLAGGGPQRRRGPGRRGRGGWW